MKDLKSVSPQTPLSELGMDSMMAVEIKQTLEREFEVFLTPQDIRSLNFAKLQEMSNKTDDSKKKRSEDMSNSDEEVAGMKLLVRVINFVDENPESCISLNTLKEEGNSEIFFIPGIEGVGKVFDSLSPKIKAPVSCLQFGIYDFPQDSIDEMALTLLPVR